MQLVNGLKARGRIFSRKLVKINEWWQLSEGLLPRRDAAAAGRCGRLGERGAPLPAPVCVCVCVPTVSPLPENNTG